MAVSDVIIEHNGTGISFAGSPSDSVVTRHHLVDPLRQHFAQHHVTGGELHAALRILDGSAPDREIRYNAPTPHATATSLSASPATPTAGQAVTLSVQVTPLGGPVPTRPVPLYTDGAHVMPLQLDSSGAGAGSGRPLRSRYALLHGLDLEGDALLSTSALGAGAHSITFRCSGDAYYVAATSQALTQTISS